MKNIIFCVLFAVAVLTTSVQTVMATSAAYNKGFSAGMINGRIGTYEEKKTCANLTGDDAKQCDAGYHAGFVKTCVHSEAGCGGISVGKTHTNNSLIVHHKHSIIIKAVK